MFWNPNPIAFSVFGLSIAWYGLSWSLAILLGYTVLYFIFKRENKDLSKLVPYIQYVFIGVLIGSRLFEMLYYQLDYFLADPMLFFRFRQGGLASHGAIFGSMLAIWLFIKKNKEFNFLWLLDHSIIAVILQGSIIRVGNFMNSELYGKVTDVPWAVTFLQVDEFPRHPVQIYEAIWLFVCFILFISIYLKVKDLKPGIIAALFLMIVLGGRVVLEFFKEAELFFLIFSKTQLISLIGVLFGIIYFTIIHSKKYQSS